jgi:hypothetical protein
VQPAPSLSRMPGGAFCADQAPQARRDRPRRTLNALTSPQAPPGANHRLGATRPPRCLDRLTGADGMVGMAGLPCCAVLCSAVFCCVVKGAAALCCADAAGSRVSASAGGTVPHQLLRRAIPPEWSGWGCAQSVVGAYDGVAPMVGDTHGQWFRLGILGK